MGAIVKVIETTSIVMPDDARTWFSSQHSERNYVQTRELVRATVNSARDMAGEDRVRVTDSITVRDLHTVEKVTVEFAVGDVRYVDTIRIIRRRGWVL